MQYFSAATIVFGLLANLSHANPILGARQESIAAIADAQNQWSADTSAVSQFLSAAPILSGEALAMAAAIRGYKMILLMPEDLSIERRQSMAAYGAQIVLTPVTGGMEYARDLAEQMQRDGKGRMLD